MRADLFFILIFGCVCVCLFVVCLQRVNCPEILLKLFQIGSEIMFLPSTLSVGLVIFVATTMCLAVNDADTFNLNLADKYVHFSGAAYCAHPRFKKDQIENW